MSIAKTLLIGLLNPKTYIWVDVLLINETKKAILIEFDGRKSWLPKGWITRMKGNRDANIKIKIAEGCWVKKF
jgi:hypothetical protein